MTAALVHRRLVLLMALASLLAFAGGAGFEPVPAGIAAVVLLFGLVWYPSPEQSRRIEFVSLALAVLLLLRALHHIFVAEDDIVVPAVHLLLLLLCVESLRSLEAFRDGRLYALSGALILAAAASGPGLLFGVAFIFALVLATMGMVVGNIRRQAVRYRIRDPEVDPRLLMRMGFLSKAILLTGAIVFLLFPRVTRGGAARGVARALPVAGFADRVSLGDFGSRIRANPEVVLRVEFPGGVPASFSRFYWRGLSYDHFDGVRWSRSPRLPPNPNPPEFYAARWGGGDITQRIYGIPLDAKVLFALHPVLALQPDLGIRAVTNSAGDFLHLGSAAPSYTAISKSALPSPELLRGVDEGSPPGGTHYLQLPTLPPRIGALADSLTKGLTTRYDEVVAIRRWFDSGFTYTLDLPASPREATIGHFLFDRRAGHCEYFSTAMVVLLRARGIPAREVNGFLGGEWNDFGKYLAVTQNDAHSWVEAWFPGYGWVPFDPTPAGGAGGAGARTSFGTGRFVLDGLRHGWNKWILGYGLESRTNLFRRTSAWLRGEGRAEPGTDSGDGSGSRRIAPWTALPLLAAILGGVFAFLLRRRRPPPETRIYLQLRGKAARAGIAVADSVTPTELLRRLRRERFAGMREARELVHLYLRARFGGMGLGKGERRRMSAALRAVRPSPD